MNEEISKWIGSLSAVVFMMLFCFLITILVKAMFSGIIWAMVGLAVILWFSWDVREKMSKFSNEIIKAFKKASGDE
jgi:hypothetical protein